MIEILLGAGPTVFYFITRPHNITTNQSSRVQFQCSIRSTLIPTFKWNFIRKGSREAETIAASGTLSAGYSIIRRQRSQVLIIPSVLWRHKGVYTCIVSSGNNSQIQAEANLNVLSKKLHVEWSRMVNNLITIMRTITYECILLSVYSSLGQYGNHREQQHSCKARHSDH